MFSSVVLSQSDPERFCLGFLAQQFLGKGWHIVMLTEGLQDLKGAAGVHWGLSQRASHLPGSIAGCSFALYSHGKG